MNYIERCCRTCAFVWKLSNSNYSAHCPVCGSISIQIRTGHETWLDGESGEMIRRNMILDPLEMVLKSLTYREREIIKLRFGLSDGRSYTRMEVCKLFRITRGDVLREEAEAIRKLRRPRRMAILEKKGLFSDYAELTMPNEIRYLIRRIKQCRSSRQ